MRNKGVKRFLSVVLIAAMVLPVTGCGGGVVAEMDKEHVYSYEEIELPMEVDEIRGMFYQDEYIYAVGTKYEESSNTYLCSMKLDGSAAKTVQLLSGYEQETDTEEVELEPETEAENGVMEEYVPEDYTYVWLNQVTMDNLTNVYGAFEVYKDYTDENGEWISESQQLLVCWNKDGETLWNIKMDEGLEEGDSFYMNSMYAKDGHVWAYGGSYIKHYNNQGEQVNQNRLGDDVNGSLYMDKEGNLFMQTWNNEYTKQFRQDVDKNTLTLGSQKEYPENLYGYNLMPEGTKYDFIVSDTTSIYSYNFGDEEPVEIMDTIDSDMYSANFSSVRLINDTQFIAAYNDPVDWEVRIALFTKIPPEEVVDKTVVVLAGMYVDSNLRKGIIEFNKSNDTYRIQLKTYSQYSTAEDYMGGYTRLNNDIISGNMPDILIVDSLMSTDSYIAKGLLADLYPYIEKDEQINKEDYLQNIFDAFSQDGKLYTLVPSFQVSSVIGKKSIVGDRSGWNMSEFKDVMSKQPEGTLSFSEMTRSGILNMALMMTQGEYIDEETGECSFDSEGFIELLEFANEFPEEIDYTTWEDDNYWVQMESAYRENRTILQNRYLYTYQDFYRMEKGEFGEDVSIIGFPTESKNGNAIIPSMQIALSARSGSLDGAWEFVRYYLTDEYQETLDYQFPIKKSVLDKMEKEATERPYWEDENGNKEYYDDTYWINDVEVKIDPMTAEEAAEFTGFLSSLTLVGGSDESIREIVEEEAGAFFAGQKTAKEVAEIIQSRVKIYVSESR